MPPVSIRHIGASWPVENSDLGEDRAGTTDHASKVRGCVVVPNPSPCHPVCLKKAPLWRYAECRLVLEEKVVGYRRGGKFLLQFKPYSALASTPRYATVTRMRCTALLPYP